MSESESSQRLSPGFRIKRLIVSTSLLALGTAFEIVSKSDPGLKAELKDWEEGREFSMGVLPDGPSITMKKEGDHIRFLGKGIGTPKLVIYFKNIDCALLPLSGQIGADTAFAQHRAILHGNVADAMQTNRAMAIVQKYLLPDFILKKGSKRPPKYTGAQLMLKMKVMSILGLAMLLNSMKQA